MSLRISCAWASQSPGSILCHDVVPFSFSDFLASSLDRAKLGEQYCAEILTGSNCREDEGDEWLCGRLGASMRGHIKSPPWMLYVIKEFRCFIINIKHRVMSYVIVCPIIVVTLF